MSMSGYAKASIAFLAAIIILFVLEITFGGAMDNLYSIFRSLIVDNKILLSAQWQGIALGTLANWKWFYRAPVIIIIALGVWMVETIFIDIDYGRSSHKQF